MRRADLLRWFLLLLTAFRAAAAEVMPPAPTRFFNDYAAVVSTATAERLNFQLREFERTNSTQVVVAVFPRMQTDSSIEDYVHRMFVAWKIGQKGKNNGVLLAVFTQDRKLRIEVGYGLEGALPDALARRIIDDEIKPHLRQSNYTVGLAAGVKAILAATKGEYQAAPDGEELTGLPGLLRKYGASEYVPFYVVGGLMVLLLVVNLRAVRKGRRGAVYDSRGRHVLDSGPYGQWWGGSSGGGWGGGGGDSGGGDSGGFSGGGGDSGGGGASGSW